MEIIEETSANWLVRRSDGSIDNIGRSSMNRALIDYDLWGLLRDGDEILRSKTSDGKQVTLIPGDDSREFTLSVDGTDQIHLGPHQKSRVTDALVDGKENDSEHGTADELLALYDDIREDMVRNDVVSALAEIGPFADAVECQSDGWLFYDHLLLTWERDFYHPDTTTYNRTGNTVMQNSGVRAYEVPVTSPEGGEENRDLTLNGDDYRLTDAEMEFIARALWAVENAPKGV